MSHPPMQTRFQELLAEKDRSMGSLKQCKNMMIYTESKVGGLVFFGTPAQSAHNLKDFCGSM